MEFKYTKIDIPQERSFLVQDQQYEEYSVIHVHKNYELNLIMSGGGKRIVGNSILPFENYDLILIGPDLPHSRELTAEAKNNPPTCLILYISDTFINNCLNQITELEPVRNLFTRALSGIAFKSDKIKDIAHDIKQLNELKGIDAFIAIINLLKTLTEIDEQEVLSLTPELPISYYKDLNQIKIIYDYVVHHVQDNITLDTASGLLNMAPGSFCRFFKKRTGKTFMQYVIDIRISIASKMLAGTEKPIAQICIECGYNNLANFNLYFKNTMKMTPSEYRKNFRR